MTETVTRQGDNGETVTETIVKSRSELRVVDSDKIDGSAAAAIQEISQGRDGMIRVKMYSKLPALMQLLDHLNAIEELRDKQPALNAQPAGEKVIDFAAALRHYTELSRRE